MNGELMQNAMTDDEAVARCIARGNEELDPEVILSRRRRRLPHNNWRVMKWRSTSWA